MTREQIENTADDFAGKEYKVGYIDRDALYKGFYHGADWRINAVWHDARVEVPDRFRMILVEKDDEGFTLNICNGKMSSCPMYWKRWAYLDDLTPERKEETK